MFNLKEQLHIKCPTSYDYRVLPALKNNPRKSMQLIIGYNGKYVAPYKVGSLIYQLAASRFPMRGCLAF